MTSISQHVCLEMMSSLLLGELEENQTFIGMDYKSLKAILHKKEPSLFSLAVTVISKNAEQKYHTDIEKVYAWVLHVQLWIKSLPLLQL